MAGEPQLVLPVDPAVLLAIDCTELNVLDPAGVQSSRIIQDGHAFRLQLKCLVGGAAAWLAGFVAAEDAYTAEFFYEGIGDLPEGSFGTEEGDSSEGVDSPTHASCLEYTIEKNIPAETIEAGTYKLSAIIRFDSMGPMFGFIEGPLMQQL